MKRLLAVLLLLAVLAGCAAGAAEEEGPTDADLQETAKRHLGELGISVLEELPFS